MPKNTAARVYLNNHKDLLPLPNLVEIQHDSYNWLIREGLAELFEEISPIEDFTGKLYALSFKDYFFETPKLTEAEAKEKNATYEASLRAQMELVLKETGEVRHQEIFLGDYPVMTRRGTFIINGVERVVVSQLVRSAGVFFTNDSGSGHFGAKIIPSRGAWPAVEPVAYGVLSL